MVSPSNRTPHDHIYLPRQIAVPIAGSPSPKVRRGKTSEKQPSITAPSVVPKPESRLVGGTIKRISLKRSQTNGRALRYLREAFAALDDHRKDEVRDALTLYEAFVFGQIIAPNYEAWLYAEAEQAWDEETDDAKVGPVHIHVEFEHLAKGLQMDLAKFEQAAAQIKTKLKSYIRSGVAVEHLDAVILRQLEAEFGIPRFPHNLELKVVRQVLTVTARQQHRKVTPKVAEMLEAVGAKLPLRVVKRLKLVIPGSR